MSPTWAASVVVLGPARQASQRSVLESFRPGKRLLRSFFGLSGRGVPTLLLEMEISWVEKSKKYQLFPDSEKFRR